MIRNERHALIVVGTSYKLAPAGGEYLASLKWEKGYCCRKYGHTKYQVRKDFSRTCNICSDTESPTAGTLFHKLKFGLLKAFYMF